MFSLTVFIGHGMWSFLYKTEEKARAAFQTANGLTTTFESHTTHLDGTALTLAQHGQVSTVQTMGFIDDDFGHQLSFNRASCHGAVLEDLEMSKLAHCERALHQQRTQIKAQQMAAADTSIRMGQNMTGPAIIDPMGMANGRMRS